MRKVGYFLILILIISGFGAAFLFPTPEVTAVFPSPGSRNVPLYSIIKIKFNKPIKRQAVLPAILPGAHGQWQFEDALIKNHLFRTLTFTPASNFKPETSYQVKIENIQGFGISKSTSFAFTFQTQPVLIPGTEPEITILEIPLDWQDYSLSCEAASLKMTLAYKGILVSEKEIMQKIGYSNIPRRDNVLGDPYQAYVGDINGKICETGYGVYWGPVAKAAQNWRNSQAFSGWEIEDLIREIELGNPVIFWGVLPTRALTDCSWYTPEGKYIPAFKETHVRVMTGFIDLPQEPSKIIINGPLAGRLYWDTNYFLKNWEVFNNSGVVVR